MIGDLVQLWHVRNTGAAFSILPGATWLFVPVTVGAIGMVVYFHRTLRDRGAWIQVILGAILAGALGNLTDRLRLGYVIDFVSFGIGDTRFPTFNVADSAVVLGIGALVAYLTFVRPASFGRGRQVTAPAESRTVEGPAPAGRVDLAVSSVAGISRAHAQRLIGDGRALVDGARRRSSDRLAGGEVVSVELSAPRTRRLSAESIPFGVAYEDETMLIVDKPAGLVVHPSAGHSTGTLVNALLGRARDRGEALGSIAGVGRPGIVHRLDKETSGLIVVAKTDSPRRA